jgi:1-phosphofructokinase
MIVTVTLNPSLDEWVVVKNLNTGKLNRALSFKRYPGGKGINVSRVAKELKFDTLAIAIAGGDDGKILGHLLAEHKIEYKFITVKGQTRNNYQIQSKNPKAWTQINCPGPCVSDRNVSQVVSLIRSLAKESSCIVFSGSLPPGLPSSAYKDAIYSLSKYQVPIVLDTSGSALAEGILARPYFVKPNLDELKELVGGRLGNIHEIVKAADHLVSSGPAIAVISLGKEGAVLVSRKYQARFLAIPPKVRIGSTVGAGDSLVAGFIIGHLKTHSIKEALRLGIACGSATAMTPGTELCHLPDVKRLIKRVRIRQI